MIKRAFLSLALSAVCASPAVAQDSANELASKIESILAEQSDYAFGDSTAWQAETLTLLSKAYGNPTALREIERVMLEFITSDTSYDAKKEIWIDFANLVSSESVPPLVEMLKSEKSDHAALALLILERVRPEAQDTLLDAFSELPDERQLNIIHHFGSVQDKDAIAMLRGFIDSSDSRLASAAFQSLAKIGDPSVADVLENAFKQRDRSTSDQDRDALLTYAERLAASGFKMESARFYELLSTEQTPLSFRAAALYGKFKLSADPLGYITNQLNSDDTGIRYYIIRMVADLPASYKKGGTLLSDSSLTAPEQIQLLQILNLRRDSSIRHYVLDTLDASEPTLRLAAMKALPQVVRKSDIDRVVALAKDADDEERELVIKALTAVPGGGVDKRYTRLMESSVGEQLQLLMEVAKNRKIAGAAELMFELTRSEERSVRREAFQTLEAIAGPAQLQQALNRLLESQSSPERRAWERTVFRLTAKIPNEDERSSEIVDALRTATDPENISSLILILGEIGYPSDYSKIEPYLQSADPAVQLRAVQALSDWPNPEPLDALSEIHSTADTRELRFAALQGVLNLLIRDLSQSDSAKIERYEALISDAQSDEERKRTVAAFGEVETVESLEALLSYMQTDSLRAEAQKSIRKIMRNVYRSDQEKARTLILKAKLLSKSPEFREWIDDGLGKDWFAR